MKTLLAFTIYFLFSSSNVIATTSCESLFSSKFNKLALVPHSAPISASEKILHTVEHKHRLRLSSIAVFKAFNYEFPHLTYKLIRSYMNLHDLPKIMTLKQLREYGYTHTETINERLLQFERRSKDSLTLEEKNEFIELRDELNRIEDQIKEEFFRKNNLTAEKIEELKRLEKIVDTVDTGLYRGNEVNNSNNAIKGSLYLKRSEALEIDIEIALWIEQHHIRIHRLRFSKLYTDVQHSRVLVWLRNSFLAFLLSTGPAGSDSDIAPAAPTHTQETSIISK